MRKHRDMLALLRIFCTRRGLMVIGVLISVWTVVGSGAITLGGWFFSEWWNDWKKVVAAAADMRAYIQTAEERHNAVRNDIVRLQEAGGRLNEVVFNHESRISRIEGRP